MALPELMKVPTNLHLDDWNLTEKVEQEK